MKQIMIAVFLLVAPILVSAKPKMRGRSKGSSEKS